MIFNYFELFIIFIFSFAIGGFSSFFLTKKRLNNQFQEEKQLLVEKNDQIIEENLTIINEKNSLAEEINNLKTEIVKLKTIEEFNQNKILDISNELSNAISEKKEVEKQYLEAQNNLSSINSQKNTLENNLKLINESLIHQFKDIANEVLSKNTARFNEDSKEKIGNLINPLNQKLQDFQKIVQDCFNLESKEKFSLKQSISQLLDVNGQIKHETMKLTNALKSNNMILGHWGEMILENILISSGLRPNHDYELQEKNHLNASRPDAVIYLPNKKSIIIDAKTSYFDTNDFNNLTNDDDKNKFIKEFTKRIRLQIDNLASKEYHYNSKLQTPELTIMFIPVESWYNIAIQHDNKLYEYAWNKNIALLSSSTLFIILKTIAYIWKNENQEENALKIAEYAGGLYDNFVELINNLIDIGKSIKILCKNYDGALSRLSSGRGNIIKRIEHIKSLGIKHKKNLDSRMIIEIQDAVRSLNNEIIIENDNENEKIIFKKNIISENLEEQSVN